MSTCNINFPGEQNKRFLGEIRKISKKIRSRSQKSNQFFVMS